ncbi:sucrose-phosphate synthase-like, partial [Dendrobium catenatum]|uniref:sucrose-phosphate synthase-like n=1 Tax=Dendrobium catenatum TaxID=906689 RepID=UPI0009F4819A
LNNQVSDIITRLVEVVRQILSEFENAVLSEPSKIAVPRGTLHPLTRDTVAESLHYETPKKKLQSNVFDFQIWFEESKEKKLYIVLISFHGLVRGKNLELSDDSDTGGQVKYVAELAKALSMIPGVDHFTRQKAAPEIDWSYGEPIQRLGASHCDGSVYRCANNPCAVRQTLSKAMLASCSKKCH